MMLVRPAVVFRLALCSAVLCGTTGCVTASLATLGTVFGALGSAASTGSTVYKLGKLDSAEMATYTDARWAVRQAADDLQLHVSLDAPDEKDRSIWNFALCDLKKSEVDVVVERRAARVCRIRVNVGFFGSEPTAKLIIHRIHTHLPGGIVEHPD